MKSTDARLASGVAFAVALALGTPTAAIAQQNAQADGLVIEEIVVTARKREESLQDVPLAVTALSSQDFERRRINDLEGIAAQTAGLNFESFTTGFNPLVTIRGLTQSDVQNRIQNVGFFLDGAYIPRNYAVNPGLVDIERVEVVKGPQSALYGQNAFAGAINYVTRKPSLSEAQGQASVTVGSAGRLDYSASFSVPLVTDRLAVRAGYGSTEYDGTRKNSFPTISGGYEELGGYDNESYNLALSAKPTDALSVDLMLLHTEQNREVAPGYTASGNRTQIKLNCGPIRGSTGNPSFWCGELPTNITALESATSNRPDGYLFPSQPGTKTESEFLLGKIAYDINDNFSVEYTYSDVDAEGRSVVAFFDDPTVGAFTYQKEGGINAFKSNEIRFVWEASDSFSLEGGYYGSKQDDDFIFGLALAFGSPSLVITDTTSSTLAPFPIPLRNFSLTEDTDAIFARLNWKIDDRTRVSFEARDQSVDIVYTDNVARRGNQSETFDSFTPRLTLERDLSDSSLLFASAAKGVKAGGFNGFVAGPVQLIAAEQTFDQEENWTYELGFKNSFLDGRLIFNAVAFYVDWSNMQITTVPTGFDESNLQPGSVAPTIFLNVGDVTNLGIEIDGQYRLDANWSFNYAFSTGTPEFEDGTKWGQFVGVCDDVFCPADGDVSGKSLPRQSETQFALGGQYETALANGMDLFARTDVTFTSKQYADALNLAYTPGRYNVNASVGVSGENWSVTGWVENLLDDTYTTNSFYIVQFLRYAPSINEGIRGGVTLSYRF